jgi:hypothetical protein
VDTRSVKIPTTSSTNYRQQQCKCSRYRTSPAHLAPQSIGLYPYAPFDLLPPGRTYQDRISRRLLSREKPQHTRLSGRAAIQHQTATQIPRGGEDTAEYHTPAHKKEQGRFEARRDRDEEGGRHRLRCYSNTIPSTRAHVKAAMRHHIHVDRRQIEREHTRASYSTTEGRAK